MVRHRRHPPGHGSAHDERGRRVARDAARVQPCSAPSLDELRRDPGQAAELQAPCPPSGTTIVRLFGSSRPASRTFASGSCGSVAADDEQHRHVRATRVARPRRLRRLRHTPSTRPTRARRRRRALGEVRAAARGARSRRIPPSPRLVADDRPEHQLARRDAAAAELVHREEERSPVARPGLVGDPWDARRPLGRARERLDRARDLGRADRDAVGAHAASGAARPSSRTPRGGRAGTPSRTAARPRIARGSSGARAGRSAPRARRSGRPAASRRRGSPCARAPDAGRADTGLRSRRRRPRRRRPARSRARERRRRGRPSRARVVYCAASAANRARHPFTYPRIAAALVPSGFRGGGQSSRWDPPVPRWSTRTMSRLSFVAEKSCSTPAAPAIADPPGPPAR